MATTTAPLNEHVGSLDPADFKKISWLERTVGPDSSRIIKALFRNPLSLAGMFILLIFLLIAAFAPAIAPPSNSATPYQIPRDGFSPDPKPPMSEWGRRQPPTAFWLKPLTGSDQWVHVFGTASGQWDIFYGVVWGTRTALKVGLIITISTVVVGLLVGVVSAFYGGVVDMIIMRIVDVFLTLPFLIAALVLSSILAPLFGKSLLAPTIALIAFGWMSYARLIRGDILSIKEREYVIAARVIGAKDQRIMFRHILPNAVFSTLVVASMDMGSYVITFAALSFLGIGAEIGYADWGQLLAFARDWITQLDVYWYIVVYPGMALVLFVLSWNLIGDAVRDILDPHMRGRGGA